MWLQEHVHDSHIQTHHHAVCLTNLPLSVGLRFEVRNDNVGVDRLENIIVTKEQADGPARQPALGACVFMA